ncbi:hypothetical protein E7V67_005805 [[Empedobacter] haloabium]|uniref:HEAT repeat domain-containing protein n=1 Tax=[Empedobacter] haloabium TaxID=592317 RepID=A0ABZ1UPK1_9BURK
MADFYGFFKQCNKERLDGLNECHFSAMSLQERARAFDFLMERARGSGGAESIHGLFVADASRAVEPVKALLRAGTLTQSGQIAAAWNLYCLQPDKALIDVFVKAMTGSDSRVREEAAYFVPDAYLTTELKFALQAMIVTEEERLPRIHAVNKLLACYGVTEDSVGRKVYRTIYRGLHSDDLVEKEKAFRTLDELFDCRDDSVNWII